jgi:hypothetical protein
VIRAVRNLLVLSALALVALPANAMAADPVADCNLDGKLDEKYKNSELRDALDNIPTDVDEYSNCREIISGAIAGGSDRGGNRPTAGADGAPLTPDEQAARAADSADLEAITADPEKNPPSVTVDGEKVEPGSNGLFDLATASNDLPLPLILVLVALVVLAVTGGVVALRDRVPMLARIPLLSKISIPRVSFPPFRR